MGGTLRVRVFRVEKKKDLDSGRVCRECEYMRVGKCVDWESLGRVGKWENWRV